MHCAVLNSLHHATNVVLYTSAELGSIEKVAKLLIRTSLALKSLVSAAD